LLAIEISRETFRAMGSSQSVRWGVIGVGWFGEIHAETLSRMPGIDLAALSTRTPSRLEEVAARLDVTGRHSDYRALLDDPTIDAVSVTTHVDDHAQITIDALDAGKHVLLEKPMARTVEDCDRIVTAAERSAASLMVGHICRFDPRVALAKEAVENGRVGTILSMHARRNLSREIGEQVLDKISALLGDGVHDADLMLWFSSAKPVSVYAVEIHPGENKYPDIGWAMIRFDDGSVGVVESIWHLPKSTPYTIDARMEIVGTAGALYGDCGNAGVEIHDESGSSLPDTAYWPEVFGARDGALRAELRYFADCVAEGAPPDRVPIADSREVVRVIAAAQESARTGSPVEL